MTSTAQLLERAKRQHGVGDFAEACVSCRHVLSLEPENVIALSLLGVAAARDGDAATAVEMLERALTLGRRDPVTLANLGSVYRQTGRLDNAERCYREALASSPGSITARFNLANLLRERAEVESALAEYVHVLQLDPSHAGALNNSAMLLRSRGQLEAAAALYRRLVQLTPNDPAVRCNLGAVLVESGDVDAGIEHYREAIALDATAVQAWNNLGVALHESGELGEAIRSLEEANRLEPGQAAVLENLGNALRKAGAVDKALEAYDAALERAAGNGTRFKRATLLPVVAQSTGELDEWRVRLRTSVDELADDPPPLNDAFAEAGVTNFNLSYHDSNNREAQTLLAETYLAACPSLAYVAPHCRGPVLGGGRLKVGFISRHFATHAVGWCFQGVMRAMPRESLGVTAIRFGGSDDSIWQAIASDVDDVLELPANLSVARERIAALELDALIYTDIGMEPLTYFLAFSRLARLQCVLAGHPETTGIPTLDLFVSSELQEPCEAPAHYSERLVCLPGAPTYYDRPTVPSPLKPRSAFGLPESANLYFCAQTIIKIHPEMDALFAGILERDPDALILLPEGYNPMVARRLSHRLARSLDAMADRVRFLPTLSHQDFMNVMALADVSLDTRPFGGGNTSWQAIAAGTPIVTWPGRYLRGRYTQALYRLAGVEDTVADSAETYIDTAVRLGRDAEFRSDVNRRVEAAASSLFSDMTHVRALRDVLLRYSLGR